MAKLSEAWFLIIIKHREEQDVRERKHDEILKNENIRQFVLPIVEIIPMEGTKFKLNGT